LDNNGLTPIIGAFFIASFLFLLNDKMPQMVDASKEGVTEERLVRE
jgi:hypothetical protein